MPRFRSAQRSVPAVPWDDAARARLSATLTYACHTEERCAVVLGEEFGVTNASQANVSRWKSGDIKQPGCAADLIAYCDTYGPGPEPDDESEDAAVRPGHEASNASSEGDRRVDETEEFDRLAGEPLLGPGQLELVTGMSRRLESGPPLSAEDRATYLDQLRILCVPSP